jgi:hypothetical protein
MVLGNSDDEVTGGEGLSMGEGVGSGGVISD